MKKFNKLLALLLALAMVFCLAACEKDEDEDEGGKKSKETTAATEPDDVTPPAPAQPTDEELLAGTWIYKADLGDLMGLTLAASLGDPSLAPDLPLYMDLAFTFANDGKGAMTVKVDQESFTAYMDALVDKMVDLTYAAFEAQGISKADADAAYLSEFGMSMKDAMKAEMDASMADSMNAMEETTDLLYKVDSDKGIIYIGETQSELDSAAEGMNYKLEGTKLTVSDIFGEDIAETKDTFEAFGMGLPWTFTKQ